LTGDLLYDIILKIQVKRIKAKEGKMIRWISEGIKLIMGAFFVTLVIVAIVLIVLYAMGAV
jgi:hypothetical protein